MDIFQQESPTQIYVKWANYLWRHPDKERHIHSLPNREQSCWLEAEQCSHTGRANRLSATRLRGESSCLRAVSWGNKSYLKKQSWSKFRISENSGQLEKIREGILVRGARRSSRYEGAVGVGVKVHEADLGIHRAGQWQEEPCRQTGGIRL